MFIIYGGVEDYESWTEYNLVGKFDTFDEAFDKLNTMYNDAIQELTETTDFEDLAEHYDMNITIYEDIAECEIKDREGYYRFYYKIEKI